MLKDNDQTVCNINTTHVIHTRLQILEHPRICFQQQMSTGACFIVWTVSHWQKLAGKQKTGRRQKDEGEQREDARGPGAESIQ